MQEELLTELEQKLDCFQGLADVKVHIHAWIRLLQVQQNEKSKGFYGASVPLHLVFMGESGTGKTQTGEFIAQVYYALGMLSEGKFIKTSASELQQETILQQAEQISGNVWMLTDLDMLSEQVLELLLEILQWEDFAVIFAGTNAEIESMLCQFPVLRLKICKYLSFADYYPENLHTQETVHEHDVFDIASLTSGDRQIPEIVLPEIIKPVSEAIAININQGDLLCSGARMDLTPYVQNQIRIRLVYQKLKLHMEMDAYVFLLYDDELTRCDEDMVFFGNISSKDGGAVIIENAVYPECAFCLNQIHEDIRKIAVCFSAYGNRAEFDFSQIEAPVLQVFQGNTQIACMDLSELQALRTLVAVELYRYHNSWKLRAVASGYCDGLEQLCKRFGIEVAS